jgi:hypothetical protein
MAIVDAPEGLRSCLGSIRILIANGMGRYSSPADSDQAVQVDGFDEWLKEWTRGLATLKEQVRALFPDRMNDVVWWTPVGISSTPAEIERCLRACELVVITSEVWLDSAGGGGLANNPIDASGASPVQVDDGVHVLRRGDHYGAWITYADLMAQAKDGVFLVDPYCDREALNLLLYVDNGVAVRILTSEQRSTSTFPSEWGHWKKDRTAASECRTMPRQRISHDRFLMIDTRLFLSGASINGVGHRMSMLMEISTEETRRTIYDSLMVDWEDAAALGDP